MGWACAEAGARAGRLSVRDAARTSRQQPRTPLPSRPLPGVPPPAPVPRCRRSFNAMGTRMRPSTFSWRRRPWIPSVSRPSKRCSTMTATPTQPSTSCSGCQYRTGSGHHTDSSRLRRDVCEREEGWAGCATEDVRVWGGDGARPIYSALCDTKYFPCGHASSLRPVAPSLILCYHIWSRVWRDDKLCVLRNQALKKRAQVLAAHKKRGPKDPTGSDIGEPRGAQPTSRATASSSGALAREQRTRVEARRFLQHTTNSLRWRPP